MTNVGLCPRCNNVVLLKSKMIFFICPHCGETVSETEARGYLDALCADLSKPSEVIKVCLDLEKINAVDAALKILTILRQYQPYNEDAAFTHVRISGYEPMLVKQYLGLFCPVKKIMPFAEEFLDKTLINRYVPLANQFFQYIENKLPTSKHKKYKEKLVELKSNYAGEKGTGDGMALMYTYYVLATIVNLAFAIFFIFVFSWALYLTVIVSVVLFVAELFILFLHNRVYGNRLGISEKERICLVIFLSSIVVTIAGAVIGAIR